MIPANEFVSEDGTTLLQFGFKRPDTYQTVSRWVFYEPLRQFQYLWDDEVDAYGRWAIVLPAHAFEWWSEPMLDKPFMRLLPEYLASSVFFENNQARPGRSK